MVPLFVSLQACIIKRYSDFSVCYFTVSVVKKMLICEV
jgi:hypothetical protein